MKIQIYRDYTHRVRLFSRNPSVSIEDIYGCVISNNFLFPIKYWMGKNGKISNIQSILPDFCKKEQENYLVRMAGDDGYVVIDMYPPNTRVGILSRYFSLDVKFNAIEGCDYLDSITNLCNKMKPYWGEFNCRIKYPWPTSCGLNGNIDEIPRLAETMILSKSYSEIIGFNQKNLPNFIEKVYSSSEYDIYNTNSSKYVGGDMREMEIEANKAGIKLGEKYPNLMRRLWGDDYDHGIEIEISSNT